MPENPARMSVQRLARQLLAEAEACPTLIHRSENSSRVTKRQSKGPFPALALLSEPALDIRQYLEKLVRIAVGSANQAENMSVEARKANRKAQLSMVVVASFGALGLMVGIAGFIASRSANVRLSEVSDEVSTLRNIGQDIASLRQQRKVEEAALARQRADQQALREVLQHQIADLRQQANSLQDQIAQRAHDLEAAGTETSKLRQNLEAARTQTEFRQDIDPLQEQQKVEQGTFARQKRHEQQTAVLPPRLLSAPPPNLASSATQPVRVLTPRPRASQQLLIARESLMRGNFDQARRVLTMVQTQMVLKPVEPDQPAAQGVDALATDVGNALRWLDMGANGQAMQALNQAMYNAGAD